MRVLYVNIEAKIAGAEKSLLLSLDELKKRCDVILICPYGQLSRAVVSRGIAWKRSPTSPRSRWLSLAGLIYIMKLSSLLLCMLVRYKPDLVHVNSIIAAFASWLPCFVIRTRFVFHVRDVPKSRLAYRFIGCRAVGVIAVSNYIRSSLVTIGVPKEKVFVIYNPLEELAAKQIGFNKHEKEKCDYVFANIGQLVPWKRQELFIEAAKIVAEKQPNVCFWIIGDDIFGRNSSYRSLIIKKIKDSQLDNRIVFKGWQDDMVSLWCQIDCLVHTADREPFGRVVVEAMQAGVPVIASKSGGPAEIIEDGVTGCLIASDEPEDFAAIMLKIISDDQKTFKITENAKKYVSDEFSQSAISDAIFCVYRRVFAKCE